MEKKDLLRKKRAILVALGSSLVLTTPVEASNIEDKINNFFKPFVDIDEAINDKIDEAMNSDTYEKIKDGASELKDSVKGYADKAIDYDLDTLDVVTFVPNSNPNEEREYYFVNSLVPGLPDIYYLDEYGYKVSKKSEDKRYKVKVSVHHTITEDKNGSKYAFEEKTYKDLVTGDKWTNTVNLSKDEPYLVDGDSSVEFGVFENVEDIIPEYLVKDEYSLKEVKELTEYINNMDNDLEFSDSLSLKK